MPMSFLSFQFNSESKHLLFFFFFFFSFKPIIRDLIKWGTISSKWHVEGVMKQQHEENERTKNTFHYTFFFLNKQIYIVMGKKHSNIHKSIYEGAVSWLLMWFEAILGLRINLDKSEILPMGIVENVEMLALELGCKVEALPSTYLGLPLGAPHKVVAVWDGVEERIRKRLAMWKRQFISKGGRITLIWSTLASMPIYLMSLMRLPRVVRLRL